METEWTELPSATEYLQVQHKKKPYRQEQTLVQSIEIIGKVVAGQAIG